MNLVTKQIDERQMNWYVIRTNPQSEKKAAGELRRAGVRVYLPKRSYQRRDRRKGVKDKTSAQHSPLLTGYIFIRFVHAPDWFGIRKCQGVKDVLRWMAPSGDFEPLGIDRKYIAQLMRRQRNREFVEPELRKGYRSKKYKKGRKMRVSDGPFVGFMAQIDRLNKSGSVTATLDIFGRETDVTFADPDVELENAA